MFTPMDVHANIEFICMMNDPDLSAVACCRLPRKKVDFFTQNDLRCHCRTTSSIMNIYLLIFFTYIAFLYVRSNLRRMLPAT